MTNSKTITEKRKALTAQPTDAQLPDPLAAVHKYHGKTGSIELRTARAWLLDEYERRNGEAAADALMDRMGM